ncbi:hypothetical protein BD779DRAFT_1026362 [Infundibulicybe gibba]|nr:hypothetical protein BD779DRAFT_1026362 [Infundibulicybe gibba]
MAPNAPDRLWPDAKPPGIYRRHGCSDLGSPHSRFTARIMNVGVLNTIFLPNIHRCRRLALCMGSTTLPTLLRLLPGNLQSLVGIIISSSVQIRVRAPGGCSVGGTYHSIPDGTSAALGWAGQFMFEVGPADYIYVPSLGRDLHRGPPHVPPHGARVMQPMCPASTIVPKTTNLRFEFHLGSRRSRGLFWLAFCIDNGLLCADFVKNGTSRSAIITLDSLQQLPGSVYTLAIPTS